jgi:hypothetical protein
MSIVERTGERIARNVSRRRFLRRSAVAIFGIAAAGAADFVHLPRAAANACEKVDYESCTCHPPYGTYCTSLSGGSNYCIRGDCNTAVCRYNYNYGWWSTACWCTKTCSYSCGTAYSYKGYYHCCDCTCAGHDCGCRGFVYTCQSSGCNPCGPGGSTSEATTATVCC